MDLIIFSELHRRSHLCSVCFECWLIVVSGIRLLLAGGFSGRALPIRCTEVILAGAASSALAAPQVTWFLAFIELDTFLSSF